MKALSFTAGVQVAAGVMFFLNPTNHLIGVAFILGAVAFKIAADEVAKLQKRIAMLEALNTKQPEGAEIGRIQGQ